LIRFATSESLDAQAYEELARRFVLRTSPLRPIYSTRTDGASFWDQNGKRYLDFISKAVCVSLGFDRREILDALHQQLELGAFSSPYELNPRQVELAETMARIAPGPLKRSAFYGSGSEAIEASIKLARRATGRPKIVSYWGSYHGSTEGALAASGALAYRRSYEPRTGGYSHLLPPDTLRGTSLQTHLELLDAAFNYEDPSQIAAVIVEPLLSGGVLEMPPAYLARLRELTTQHGIILVFDEVITGFGRTGTMFYCEQAGTTPDILVGAKGMSSSYVPCSVMMVTDGVANRLRVVEEKEYVEYLGRGHHLVTSQNHPLACAAALATIAYIQEHDVLEQVTRSGRRLLDGLGEIASRHRRLTRPRGCGLIAGIDVVQPDDPMAGNPGHADRIAHEAEARGLIVGTMKNRLPDTSLVFMAPPLTVSEDEIDEALRILDSAVLAAA
jgi:taurine--2-oxoglutarate transaminase